MTVRCFVTPHRPAAFGLLLACGLCSPGRGALADGQDAAVKAGAVAQVGQSVRVEAEGLLADPGHAFATHPGETDARPAAAYHLVLNGRAAVAPANPAPGLGNRRQNLSDLTCRSSPQFDRWFENRAEFNVSVTFSSLLNCLPGAFFIASHPSRAPHC